MLNQSLSIDGECEQILILHVKPALIDKEINKIKKESTCPSTDPVTFDAHYYDAGQTLFECKLKIQECVPQFSARITLLKMTVNLTFWMWHNQYEVRGHVK